MNLPPNQDTRLCLGGSRGDVGESFCGRLFGLSGLRNSGKLKATSLQNQLKYQVEFSLFWGHFWGHFQVIFLAPAALGHPLVGGGAKRPDGAVPELYFRDALMFSHFFRPLDGDRLALPGDFAYPAYAHSHALDFKWGSSLRGHYSRDRSERMNLIGVIISRKLKST